MWASTFLVLRWNVSAEQAATLAGLFFIGITTGRAISGFATFKFNDSQMVRIGLMPFYLLALLALMIVTHEQLCRR